MPTKAELERQLREARAEIDLLINRESSQCTQSEPLPRSSATPGSQNRHVSPPPLMPTVLKDQKLDPPPKFDGKTAEYATFIGHCEFYFENKPAAYLDNDKNKVNLVISHLCGRPAMWAHSIREADTDDDLLHSWDLLKAQMNELYADTYQKEQLRREFHNLKQTGSARNYAAEFKTLVTILNINEDTKIYLYKEHLKDKVKESLALVTTGITTFSDLVTKSIEIDQTLFDIAKAAKKEAAKKEPLKFQNPAPPSSSVNRTPQPHNFSMPSAVASSH